MIRERIVVDQMGYEVGVPHTPKRVVSLVPSQTELIDYLGCSDSLIGVTKFCIHPAHFIKEKTIIGGTKKFRFDTIKNLNPDLIIGNKEENYEEGIIRLKENYPVWMSDIANINEAIDMISKLGLILNRQDIASDLINNVLSQFNQIEIDRKYKVLYFIWNSPKMVAGSNTFIDEMLNVAGFENLAPTERYPEISDDEIAGLNPEVILLSSEPYPFKEKHIKRFKDISPNSIIKIVDGELFSWYGSRLLKAPTYFIKLHEELTLRF